MRAFWIGAVLALLPAGCAPSPDSRPVTGPDSQPASSPQSVRASTITPANIRRVGREMPPNYEVTNIARATSPRAIWGVAADAVATPSLCMSLTGPAAGHNQPAQGVSGSGPGGIVDAVVATSPAGPTEPDHDAVAGCSQFDLVAGRTTVHLSLVDAPHIDAAQTLGMVADIRAAVESGSEIDSRAFTFIAYLGDYYVFTTLTADPGSMLPPLPPQYAADLLVKTVSTLRG